MNYKKFFILLFLFFIITLFYFLTGKTFPEKYKNSLFDILNKKPVINKVYYFDSLREKERIKNNEIILVDRKGGAAIFIFPAEIEQIKHITVKCRWTEKGNFEVIWYKIHNYYIWKWIVSIFAAFFCFWEIYKDYKLNILNKFWRKD
ncbi:MAG TPA: hypothetical protein PLD27_00055 [bacterium]|nr:hypothetical protein [bacterium]HOL47153.1 hypothetical protein [bacterium]HPQ18076.1 hypothetical protein [bacterium]